MGMFKELGGVRWNMIKKKLLLNILKRLLN